MRKKTNILLAVVTSAFLLGGCAKELEEYNKPAIHWYTKIVESIAEQDLEKADSYYTSLQGEHIGSPLLPEAILILSIAHMHYNEYRLSEHFSNEYVKRYANANEREFAEYMKIKAKYMALPHPRRDQVLIQEAIRDGEAFKKRYPRSMYYALVDNMLTNLKMAEAALNESIASLYDRLDKPRSAAYYRELNPQPWIDWENINEPDSVWYRSWFEGDGGESWYGFLIPDTKSVVSRNTVQEDYIAPKEDGNVTWSRESFRSALKKQALELEKAKEMRENGILNSREFQKLRREILGSDLRSYYQDLLIVPKQTAKKLTSTQQSQLDLAKSMLDEGALSEEEYKNLEQVILNN